MKQTRTAAFARHNAPLFALHSKFEIKARRLVGHFARALFDELVALARPDGTVATSYAVLFSLLEFDEDPNARGADRPPTLKRIRGAIDSLEAVDLVRLDRDRNRADKGLFFQLRPREGIASSDDSQGRPQGRRNKGKKLAPARVSEVLPLFAGQTAGQGIQEREIQRARPLVDNSKPLRDTPTQRAMRRRVKAPLSIP